MARYLESELASLIDAYKRCLRDSVERSAHWRDMADTHEATIERLVKDFMPSGSGFDAGTKLDLDLSHAERLVFTTSYHHMNDGGYYDGWTEHTVTVTPGFNGSNIRISGRDRNGIKDYIHSTFGDALGRDVEFATWQYVFACRVMFDGDIWHSEVSKNGRAGNWESVGSAETRELAERLVIDYIKAKCGNVVRIAGAEVRA